MNPHALFQTAATAALLLFVFSLPANGNELADGLAHFEAGDMAQAEAVFKNVIAADPDNAEAVYRLGLLQMARGEFDESVVSFERALELDDDVAAYHLSLGEALGTMAGTAGPLKQMRLVGRIRGAFERAVELDGANIDARFGLLAFYVNAPGIVGGSDSKALEQAEAIRELDPAKGHLAFANIYAGGNDEELAEKAFRTAIEVAPDDSDPYLALGLFFTAKSRYGEAIEVYGDWLESNPGHKSISYQMGRTASLAGEFLDEGRAALEGYLHDYMPKPGEPSLAWANYRLGLILQQQDEIVLARAALERAVELEPDHKPAKKALKRLR